jgi:hypothetical protein
MPKKQPPPSPRAPDDVYEERTVVLSRHPRPELSGLMSGESMDLPFDDAVDLDDADMESVSDASIDDIVLTEEELIATGGFRLGQLRAVAESSKGRPRQPAKSPPPPPAKARSTGKVPKTPPKSGAPAKPVKKPAAKGKAPGFDNAWAIEAKRLLERWLPDPLDVEIVRAHQVNTREPQERLWERHRARFGAKQDLGRSLASAAVADALRTVPQDQLVALELRAGTRYFLVWVDLSDRRLVAVLSDLKVS